MKKIKVQQQVISLIAEGEPKWLPETIETSEAAAECFAHLGKLSHEECWIVGVNGHTQPIGCVLVSRGGSGATGLVPADIFKPLISMNARAFIMAHNHPSGDATPGNDDRETTFRIFEAGQLLGIPLLDHIVVSATGWCSMRQLEAAENDGPTIVEIPLEGDAGEALRALLNRMLGERDDA